MTMATGNAPKAVFEEGKAYKCGGEVFTVTARGDIAVGFENSDGNIFSARIRGTADSECACYAGMTIWAAEEVNADEKANAEITACLDDYIVDVDAAAEVEEINAEKNSLQAKVAEILNRPRKPVIDWKATFEDMQISEIFNLQKDLKKFLKLGQIELDDKIFANKKIPTTFAEGIFFSDYLLL